jgi:hypothetical protein
LTKTFRAIFFTNSSGHPVAQQDWNFINSGRFFEATISVENYSYDFFYFLTQKSIKNPCQRQLGQWLRWSRLMFSECSVGKFLKIKNCGKNKLSLQRLNDDFNVAMSDGVCQIFLATTYQSGQKYLYQITGKYTK